MAENRGFEFFDKIPIAICITNSKSDILYVNQQFEKLFGYQKDDFSNLPEWFELVFPDKEYQKQVSETIIKSTHTNGNISLNYVFNFTCKDNSVKNIEVSSSNEGENVYLFFNDLTKIYQANVSLLRENIFTLNLINSLPGIFYLYKKVGDRYRLRMWNKIHEVASGYSAEELYDKEPTDFFITEDIESTLKTINNIQKSGDLETEINFLHKSGNIKPFFIKVQSFTDNNEDYLIGTAFDVSEIKNAHDALEKNRLFSKKIAENSPNFIYIYDIAIQENIYMNRDLGNYLGYSDDELPGKTNDFFQKLLHPDDLLFFQNLSLDFDNCGPDFIQNFEYRLLSKSGEWKWFFGQEKEFERKNGKVTSLLGTLTDISKNKQDRIALQESEEKFRTLVETLPDIIIVTDYNGNVLYSNNEHQRENEEKQPESILYEGNLLKIHPVDAETIQKLVEQFIEYKEHILGPLIIRYTDNVNTYWFRRLTSKINYHGTPALQIINTDITNLMHAEDVMQQNEKTLLVKNEELKHLNIELKQSYEKLKLTNDDLQTARIKAQESDLLKTAFLQNMSHEIRTPLNGILGFSSLITGPNCSKEQQNYYSKIITESSEQLLNIVDDIINISKIETGQSEIVKNIVYPKQLLTELFECYREKCDEKKIYLGFSPESSEPDISIITDEGKLRQILTNILSNALKYTSAGKIEAGFKIEHSKVKFWISDTGIGIARENFQKIFERFVQIDSGLSRTYGGTGLGLTIAKANAELLGGNIWVESEPGKGSSFNFYIEYIPVEIPKTNRTETIDNNLLKEKKFTILIAEDEEFNFLYLEEIIKEFNYRIIHAVTGREAIEKFALYPDIDMVLLDIKMPEMNGFEVLEIIKLQRPTVPVIAQTAYALITDRQKAINAGFDEYIAKPIKRDELLKLINKVLGRVPFN